MLFNTIARLKEGDRVKFSGQFVTGSRHRQGGLRNRAERDDGGMSEHQLIFRFTEVAPL